METDSDAGVASIAGISSLKPSLEALRQDIRTVVDGAPQFALDEETFKRVPTKVAGVYVILEDIEIRYIGKGWPLRGRIWQHGRVRRISAPTNFQGAILEEEFFKGDNGRTTQQYHEWIATELGLTTLRRLLEGYKVKLFETEPEDRSFLEALLISIYTPTYNIAR